MSNSNVIQSLWIGGSLSKMEQLSIKSFLDYGFEYHLYTYGEVKFVPKGAIIKDGNEILPESEIFTYSNGSYSAFSNYFRFAMLHKKGGFWADTDLVCIKKFDLTDKPFVFVSETYKRCTQTRFSSFLIKIPQGSEVALEAINIQKEHKELILSGKMKWGSGPLTVNAIIENFNLQKYVLNWKCISSCSYEDFESIVNPNFKPNRIENNDDNYFCRSTKKLFNETFAIHLWNERWRVGNINKNHSYSNICIYSQLLKKHNLEKINILYLVNKKTFLTKMSRVRFHGINALSKLANVHYSGIGWEDYDNDKNVQKNIDNISKNMTEKMNKENPHLHKIIMYPTSNRSYKPIFRFDIVIAYKPLEMININNINVPLCIRYNEMHDVNWTLKEIKESRSKLVICHHLNDCEEYKERNIEGITLEYVGHCAEKTIFKDYGFEKKYDLMLGGYVNGHYPLRQRLKKILEKLKTRYKVYIHPHPGYDLNDAHTDKYLIEFAKKINQSKIVVTDSGKPRSRYGKYIEIPACNTVLAADYPNDSADDYSYMIKLDIKMSDKQIEDKLIHHLKNNEDYEKKRKKGIEFASKYAQEDYGQRLLEKIKTFLYE